MRRSSDVESRRGRGILLALRGSEAPKECLERASRVAEGLGEQLLVLRVLAPRSVWCRVGDAFGIRAKSTGARDAHGATRRWLRATMGDRAQTIPITVTRGAFAQRATSYARYVRARMLILSGRSSGAGRVALRLAHDTGAQVLIARGQDSVAPILAATDLLDPRYPVLRSAAELARTLGQPLVTFHNVDPLSIMSGPAAPSNRGLLPGATSTVAPRESLASVSRILNIEPSPILRMESDPVHAILDEAAVCDASLIVVGTRPCSWWRLLMSDHISERVGSLADRAVLVTPVVEHSAFAARP